MSSADPLLEIVRTETLVPEPAQALAALLDLRPPDNGYLPAMWHCVYLLDRARQSDLGADGHPFRNAIPTPPAAHRMFAGGRVSVKSPLSLGRPATRRTSVIRSTTKAGRSGRLIFVTVASTYVQDGEVRIRDEQDLAYRDTIVPQSSWVAFGDGSRIELCANERAITVDSTLLFRFSALTYNAHRVHYDRLFTSQVERYPGLLVHGPLQALLMAEQARSLGCPTHAPHQYEYRLHAPLFDDQGLVVGANIVPECGSITAHTRDMSGRRTASGKITYGSA